MLSEMNERIRYKLRLFCVLDLPWFGGSS
jgi:hypothetical protein